MIESIPTNDEDIEKLIRKLLRENGVSKMEFIKSHMLTMNTLMRYFQYESLGYHDFIEFLDQQQGFVQSRFADCYSIGQTFERELLELSRNDGNAA